MSVVLFWIAASCLVATAQDRNPQVRANEAEDSRQKLYQAAQAIIAPEMVGRDMARDLACLESLKPLSEHLSYLEKEYATEIREGNQPYRNVEGTIRYSRERIDQFKNALIKYASLTSLNEDVDHTRKMVKLAQENQAPAFFNEGNDISNRRLSIECKLRVMKELGNTTDLAKATDIAKGLDKEVLDAQKKLGKLIIEGNALPTDNYQLGDRAELLKLVESTWTKAEPKKKPLMVGLIGNNWQRTEQWEIQNRTIYKVDRSQIQGFVVVAHDRDTVICHRILIRRDHVDQDQTTARLFDDPSKDPEPRQLILASKVKRKR